MSNNKQNEQKLSEWKKPELVELNIEKDTQFGSGIAGDGSTTAASS